jgi:diguanylate cyclase (GGDEF)-like protein
MVSVPFDYEQELAAHQAMFDDLTGLLNRRGLEEEFDRLALAMPGEFSAVCIDLDNLKQVNDAYGHQAGDDYIAKAANVLRDSVRTKNKKEDQERELDIVAAARIGGDEFVVLLVGAVGQEAVGIAVERIRENLAKDGIEASLGSKSHQHDENFVVLMKGADDAVYDDKRRRKAEEFNKLPRRKKIAAKLGGKLLRFAGMNPPRQ